MPSPNQEPPLSKRCTSSSLTVLPSKSPATTRPLEAVAPTVRAISGDPLELVAAVQAQVGDGGIYLDGGALIRAVLDAGVVDELTITVVPVILGAGTPLFAGARRRHELELLSAEPFDDGLVQLKYAVTI